MRVIVFINEDMKVNWLIDYNKNKWKIQWIVVWETWNAKGIINIRLS